MRIIQLDKYLPVIVELHAFYKYSEHAFDDQNILNSLIAKDFQEMRGIVTPFIVDAKTGEPTGGWEHIISSELEKQTNKIISSGLAILRQQLLEASHSIFEKYLCHVVRVYLHVFPQILMESEKNVPFRVIADLKDNSAVFDYAVEKEVDGFGRQSLSGKKKYVMDRLKLTHQDEVWMYEGKELWKDVDMKRQAIVHQDEVPDISPEYLFAAMHYLKRAMALIAIFAQTDQGVRFSWSGVSDYIKRQEQPKLR